MKQNLLYSRASLGAQDPRTIQHILRGETLAVGEADHRQALTQAVVGHLGLRGPTAAVMRLDRHQETVTNYL